MAEQTVFEGGFERTYDTGTIARVEAGNSGFIECNHSQLDKPLKIHVSTLVELASNAEERDSAYFRY